jgi:hypothetical protein
MVEIERRPVKCSSQSLFASSRPELSRPSQRSWWATLPPTRRTCCSTNLRRHYDTSTSYPILPIQSVRRQELSPRCSRPSFENSALLDLSLTPSFLPFPSLPSSPVVCRVCSVGMWVASVDQEKKILRPKQEGTRSRQVRSMR